MAVTEKEAVEAARTWAMANQHQAFRENSIRVQREVIDGRDVWYVAADRALEPGEPDWAFDYDYGTTYIVDAVSGVCVGIDSARGRRMFGPDGR